MNVHIEPQIISYNGKPAFAVIPWDETGIYRQAGKGPCRRTEVNPCQDRGGHGNFCLMKEGDALK